ncbi:winged helix-turn-helix domain-containing protein [Jiangella alkaliphila]|uniref:Regulatory protein, gntR family n=1 Tax=Jiangella alkaliphila TaxID=419479 RepID=A0A1H2L8D3_9ACTN|nr:winged helix-turn-helix domain-containing protein [Jiangella alkaliphila]SDU77094.1 regulatory protein, gntR family [Jiangella alkaliphila]
MIDRDAPGYHYQQVADLLRDRMLVGNLSKKRRLPSQPALAREYRTSVDTVRRAVAVLREEGIVTVVHGRGMFGPEVEDRGEE